MAENRDKQWKTMDFLPFFNDNCYFIHEFFDHMIKMKENKRK